MQARGDDSHDGVVPGVERDVFSEDVRGGAELALPQSGADESDWTGSDALFILREGAANHRLDA